MSNITKKKISDSIKKFSICKGRFQKREEFKSKTVQKNKQQNQNFRKTVDIF